MMEMPKNRLEMPKNQKQVNALVNVAPPEIQKELMEAELNSGRDPIYTSVMDGGWRLISLDTFVEVAVPILERTLREGQK